MFISSSNLTLLKEYFKAKSFIRTVSIYGSVVNGRANANSDLDLLIEIDYEKLRGNGVKFLNIYKELSQLLKREVSVITKQSVSSYIKPYIDRESVLIYERDLEVNVSGFFIGDFDKSMYRDLARLNHIHESMSRLVNWTQHLSLADFQKDQIIISASVKELETISGFALQLSPGTLQFLQHEVQSNDNNLFIKSFYDHLKKGMGPYFGSDSAVIFDVLRSEIPKQLQFFRNATEGWEGHFKTSLTNYFVNFLYYRVNNDLKYYLANTHFETFINTVLTTVNGKPLESLSPPYIEEGERNLIWFAYQLNIKRSWKEVLNGVCPLFPFC